MFLFTYRVTLFLIVNVTLPRDMCVNLSPPHHCYQFLLLINGIQGLQHQKAAMSAVATQFSNEKAPGQSPQGKIKKK